MEKSNQTIQSNDNNQNDSNSQLTNDENNKSLNMDYFNIFDKDNNSEYILGYN